MGRHPKPIDWKQVETRMEAGNSAEQIASVFGIHVSNFYIRYREEYGKDFANFATPLRSCGKGNLAYVQYVKALSGNVQMMIWLGRQKEWLGQKDRSMEADDDFIENLRKFVADYTKNNQPVPDIEESVGPCVEDQQPILYQESSGNSNPLSDELGTAADIQHPPFV